MEEDTAQVSEENTEGAAGVSSEESSEETEAEPGEEAESESAPKCEAGTEAAQTETDDSALSLFRVCLKQQEKSVYMPDCSLESKPI